MTSEKRFDLTKRNEHNITITRQAEYAFVTESYTGDGGYKTGENLFKFKREDDFYNRKKQVYYRNYIKGINDSLITPVFSTQAIRNYDNDYINVFFNNVDNKSTKIQDFTKKAVHYSKLHGVSFIVMDNFPEDKIPLSVIEQLDNRLLPYAYVKTASTVYKYKINEFGELTEISFYDSMIEKDKKAIKSYKLWTKEYSQRFIIDGDKVVNINEPVFHNLGILPVISLYSVQTDSILPPSPFFDMCRINLAVYNQDSEQRMSERHNAFSILFIPSMKPEANVDVGNDSILWIDGQTTSVIPSYIEPNPENLKILGERADSNLASLIEQANILGATAVETGATAKSGVALGYEFLGQNYALKETAKLAEEFEVELVNLFDKYINQTNEYNVKYSDNYAPTLTDLMKKLELFERILDMDISDTVKDKVRTDIVDTIASLQKYSSDDVNILKSSIIAEGQLI